MKRQWTPEEAQQWYRGYPWLRGCNFIGSDCASRIDMWQSCGAEAHLATADRELAKAEEIGFNTVRLLIEFDVWYQEHDAFMDILEQYIALCAKHHQYVLLCLANEAVLSRGDTFHLKPLGEQFFALGYHQGRLPETDAQKALPPIHPLELEKEGWRDSYLQMVREIVGRYAHDSRVICWNVYNEPGIHLKSRAEPLVRLLFETVRAQDPDQPLCSDIWTGKAETLLERAGFELSDVISFHSYSPYREMVPVLEEIMKTGRPIFMTEWLNRINHSCVEELYPLFYLEHIANWCWGFVVGKTQTHEPWDAFWEQYENGTHPELDFTKWQHDLFRPNLRPYDPHEIDLIRRYNTLADQRFEQSKD